MQVGSLASGLNQIVRTSERPVPSEAGAPVQTKPQQIDGVDAAQVPVTRSSYVHVQSRPAQFFASAASDVTSGAIRPVRTVDKDVENAHQTAWSALKNERFRQVLEHLSDVRTSDALMMIQPAEGSGTDINSARARYAENSE